MLRSTLHYIILGTLAFSMMACSFRPQRTGYDRLSGTWSKSTYKTPQERQKKAAQSQQASSGVKVPGLPSSSISGQGPLPHVIIDQPSSSELKDAIQPWIGTPYLWAGSSLKGTDCSGFVMRIMKKVNGIDLPHSTKETWRFGKDIDRDDLEPGDILFFGNLWSVNHNAIYMGNGLFAHASSSRGVMYEKLSNSYWAPKYQGARRY